MKNRKILMIPGPIEFDPEVMQAMGTHTNSHVAPDFIESFGNSLDMMKEVWLCPSGQAFIMAGSGTLAMDMAAANLIEPQDNALVVSTGYFGLRYAEILERYGANVTLLQAKTGDIVSEEDIEKELKSKSYKLLTFTHVDTSTGVMNDPKPFGKLGNKYNVITILDGVCSVAGEEIHQEKWGIDVVLTASQKAIGVPPGLALMVVSTKAMKVWEERKTKVSNYYADWTNWLPIMQAYANRKPSYFATPAVNLVQALEASLKSILSEGMENRFRRHQKTGDAVRSGLEAMGLNVIPLNKSLAANTLSAPYFPDSISAEKLLPEISKSGIVLAGGLLPELKTKYFRIGHMGCVNQNDILSTIGAIESGLIRCGYKMEPGKGLGASLNVLVS